MRESEKESEEGKERKQKKESNESVRLREERTRKGESEGMGRTDREGEE